MIGKRFKEIRTKLGYSQKEFADLLGIGLTTLKDYEREKFTPKTEVVLKLISLFNINPNWLLTGQGEMFLKRGEGNKYIGSAVGEESTVQNIGAIIGENVKVIKTESEAYMPTTGLKGLLKKEIEILERIKQENPKAYPKAVKKLERDIQELEELFLT